MKKMLLISHAFHQKTKSIDFLIDLFKKDFCIDFCYLDPYDPKGNDTLIPYLGKSFDLVVFIQVVPPPDALKQFSRSRMVFFPMYDHSGSWGIETWFPLRHLRIISFSSHLTQQLRQWGFDVQGIQFFPRPEDVVQWGDPQRAFFWYRTEKINLTTVGKLLSKSPAKAIHVHVSMDPGQVYVAPSEEFEKQFEITDSEWFDTREELTDLIESCGLYFAPRLKEGIGLSFLEAMAMGRCIVAPDRPTMNEYITHGETGFLYDPSHIEPLGFLDIQRIQEQALAYVRTGYAKWELDKGNIVHWCQATPILAGWRPWFHLALRIVFRPFKVSKQWRRRAISIRFRRGVWKVRLLGWTIIGK